MRNLIRCGWLAAALFVSPVSYAGEVEISGAWARATVPGQDAASVDLTITSKNPATLVGVSSTACQSVELHSMSSENGMMRMREVKSMALPAGKPENLHDSGYHLMLVGLKAPLKEGEMLPLTLSIKTNQGLVLKFEVKAAVKPMNAFR